MSQMNLSGQMMVGMLLAGMSMAQPAATPTQDVGSVAGQIVDSATGQPLKKVQVVLRPEKENARPIGTVSDDSGAFKLEGVIPGRYRLSALRSDYLRQEYGAKSPQQTGTSINLRSGQTLLDLTIRLTAYAVIVGRVVDDGGEAVVNASVQAMRTGLSNGQAQLQLAKGSLTNDLGEYRIFGLPPGRYYLSAVAPEASTPAQSNQKDPSSNEGFASIFYPAALDAASASPINLAGGQHYQGADFRLTRTRTVSVRGVVQNMVANRPGRTMVRLMPANSGMFGIVAGKFTSELGPNGSFELGHVPPGTYVLSADYHEGAFRYSGRRLINVGISNIDGITLPITAGVEVVGVLMIESKDGLQPGNAKQVRVALVPRDSTVLEGREAAVKSDGSFAFQHISPELYEVRVRGLPDGVYLKSGRLGNQDILTSLAVTEGGLGDRLVLLASGNGGTISGTVADQEQKPVAGAIVVLAPDFADNVGLSLMKNATSEGTGAFTIRGIPPGKYRLAALEATEEDLNRLDPQSLNRVLKQAQSIEIGESETVRIQLKLVQGAQLAGLN